MTAAVAPHFGQRYAEAAIIFDNLHSMHDVISDILANPAVPRNRKRAEILFAAARFRDDTSYVMTESAWRTMTEHMGVENMGGPSVGFLPALPAATVTYGAVMSHDDRTGAMTGFKYGASAGRAHEGHGAAPPAVAPAQEPVANPHAGHEMPTAPAQPTRRATPAATAPSKTAPTKAAASKPTTRRKESTATKSTTKKTTPAKKPAPATKKPASKPADPHAGHQMPME
jgi:hypothetical protein